MVGRIAAAVAVNEVYLILDEKCRKMSVKKCRKVSHFEGLTVYIYDRRILGQPFTA